jgi:hypothetical protein
MVHPLVTQIPPSSPAEGALCRRNQGPQTTAALDWVGPNGSRVGLGEVSKPQNSVGDGLEALESHGSNLRAFDGRLKLDWAGGAG